MPLNRPALTLGPGPKGVRDARRFVVDICHAIGRDELAECAELGVSELVTNAVLHGAAPIQVSVRGTAEHPRVEVRDSSVERPVLPTSPELDPEDLLLTFGRGLALVARASDAWGAEIERDGKVVWFAPSPHLSESEGVEGVITAALPDDDGPDARPDDLVDITVYGVPVRLYLGFQRHFRELRREVRLLALAHESSYPLAKSLSDLFGSLERQLHGGIETAQLPRVLEDTAVADLHVTMPVSATTTLQHFLELLDLADEFCRAQRLLSLARTPEQRSFQQWLIGEYIRQARGGGPAAWSGRVRERVAH